MKFILKCLLVLVLFSIHNAYARPKVGLVLGGGGAAGVAHVGVLRVLEENHIPVDVIAGNSMGAIIGSLYASGKSVDEIEKIARELDWLRLFQDDQNYQARTFQQKQQSSDFFGAMTVGVDKQGIKLSGGLIEGQRLMFELRRLLAPVERISDFDKLPIPFRAVATDISTGETVVLKNGNLATAVRASMSIPAVFAPVTINNRLLVDGLVSNNVPVDVAREMGADILIVSRIPDGKKRTLKSGIDIALQTMDILVRKSTDAQLATLTDKDILIESPIGDINSLEFNRVLETIPLGEQGARAQQGALQRLATQMGLDYSTTQVARVMPPTKNEALLINHIQLQNGSTLKDSIVRQSLGFKEGDVLEPRQLQAGLDAVYGLGYFSLVDYALNPNAKGGYDLTVMARPATQGNQRLSAGFSLTDNFNGDTGYQAGVKYVNKGLTNKGTELRVQGIIGERLQAQAELHHPLQNKTGKSSKNFLEPRVWYQERDAAVFQDSHQVAELRASELGGQLDIGHNIGNTAEIRAGVFGKRIDPNLKTGSFIPKDNVINEVGVKAQYQADTLDSVNFPMKGGRANVTVSQGIKALGSDSNFTRLEVEGERVISLTPSHRIITSARATANNNNKEGLLYANTSTLQPGRLAFPNKDQWVGNYAAEGAVTYMRQLTELPHVAKVHAGASLGIGQEWEHQSDMSMKDLKTAGTVFVGAETPVGPAFAGVRKVEGFDQEVYFNFGRDF